MLATPAESGCADLEIFGWEWRRRSAERLEEGDNSWLADCGADSEHGWQSHRQGLEDVEGLVEESYEPAGWLHDFIH